MQGSRTGIGPALSEARISLGKTIEEVSRDTKIKGEYLHALEEESFGSLPGAVYARSFLRSYSIYLGLDADRVSAVYDSAAQGTVTPQGPDPSSSLRRPVQATGLRLLRPRSHWALALGLALVLLVVFGIVGLLSRSGPGPAGGGAPAVSPTEESVVPPLVSLTLSAISPVPATIVADGTTVFQGTLPRGEPLDFSAGSLLRVHLQQGGLVWMKVNNHAIGTPGDPKVPYEASFLPGDYQESPPSAGG